MKIIYEVGDKVILPLDETGIIVGINNEPLDFYPYKIKMIKINPLYHNKTNEIHEYKYIQLKPEL